MITCGSSPPPGFHTAPATVALSAYLCFHKDDLPYQSLELRRNAAFTPSVNRRGSLMPIPLIILLLAAFGVFSAGFFTGRITTATQGISGVVTVLLAGLIGWTFIKKNNENK